MQCRSMLLPAWLTIQLPASGAWAWLVLQSVLVGFLEALLALAKEITLWKTCSWCPHDMSTHSANRLNRSHRSNRSNKSNRSSKWCGNTILPWMPHLPTQHLTWLAPRALPRAPLMPVLGASWQIQIYYMMVIDIPIFYSDILYSVSEWYGIAC